MSEVDEQSDDGGVGDRPHEVEIAFKMLADVYQPEAVVGLNGLALKRTERGRLWAVYHDGELCDVINLWKFKSAIELGQYLSRVRRRVEQSDSDGEAPWLQ